MLLFCLWVATARGRSDEERRRLGKWVKVENGGKPIDISMFMQNPQMGMQNGGKGSKKHGKQRREKMPPERMDERKRQHKKMTPERREQLREHIIREHQRQRERRQRDKLAQADQSRPRIRDQPTTSSLGRPEGVQQQQHMLRGPPSGHTTKSTDAEERSDIKVFGLGTNHTYETSLRAMLNVVDPGRFGVKNTCMNKCFHRESWIEASKLRRAVTFERFSAFLHGESADYEWLSEAFENSRFVLNSRPLRDWLVSMYGSGGGGGSYKTRLADELCREARRQSKILTFFSSRQNTKKLVVVDASSPKTTDTMAVLRWMMEDDDEGGNRRPVLSAEDLRLPVSTNAEELDNLVELIPVTKIQQREEPRPAKFVVEEVESLLLELGCSQEHFTMLLYEHCATRMADTCKSVVE